METLAEPNNTERIRVSSSQIHVIAVRHFPSLSPELYIFSRIFFVCISNIYTNPTVIISSKVGVCAIRNMCQKALNVKLSVLKLLERHINRNYIVGKFDTG